jgi:hypothetical protein
MGQKRKWCHARVMSVLSLKADIRQHERHVRYVPLARQPRAAEVALRESEQYHRSTGQEFLRHERRDAADDEMTEGHEVLTREPAPVRSGRVLCADSSAG